MNMYNTYNHVIKVFHIYIYNVHVYDVYEYKPTVHEPGNALQAGQEPLLDLAT